MSQDLFLGKTKRNWSREPAASNPEYEAKMKASAQANRLARLGTLKAKADSGDKKAQKKWARVNKKVAKLHLKASKGDLKAAKQLAMLTPTGLFVTTVGPKVLKTAMKGTFVGKDEILGTFVGKGTVTKIRGNDKLTEIVTSGGAFVGNDKLTEIISSGAFVGDEDIDFANDRKGYDTIRAKFWKKPFPVMIDQTDASSYTNSKVTVMNVPFKDFVAEGLKNGKIKLATQGRRLFILKNAPWGVVATERPSSSSGAFVGNDALTEIVTSGRFVGEEELALAAEGGASERAALKRRGQRRIIDPTC